MDSVMCKKCGCCDVVKAGFVHRKQRYRCTKCKCSFLPGFKNVYEEKQKMDAVRLYLEGMSIRGIGRFLKVSHVTILRWIKEMAKRLRPLMPSYAQHIEIDELYFYLGKKKRKRWLWLAICRESKRILGFQIGGRGQKTLEKLYYKIRPIKCQNYYTDRHAPYSSVLPQENHSNRKGATNVIEGINSSIRRYLSRFHRRSKCYSKSLVMTEASLELLRYRMDEKFCMNS